MMQLGARLIGELEGLFVADMLNSEPVEDRRARTAGAFEESVEDLISRAQLNPNAILFGTFHLYEKDDG